MQLQVYDIEHATPMKFHPLRCSWYEKNILSNINLKQD